MKLRLYGVEFSAPIYLDGISPHIHSEGSFWLGSGCAFRAPRVRQTFSVSRNALLEIGENGFFNEGVNICSSQEIRIGKAVKMGDFVCIFDTDFHQVTPERSIKVAPVRIGDNVWIGANSMILAGSSIGDHTIISAGSIVSGDIPDRCVAAGAPAKVVKTFDAPDGWIRR